MVSLSGAPWGSPTNGGLASPNAVSLRMSSPTNGGGLISPSARGRFEDMDGGAFALPGPAMKGAEGAWAAPRIPAEPMAASASASVGSPERAASPVAGAAVPARGTRLDRVASRGSLSLVSPGTPVHSTSASPSVSPAGAHARRAPSTSNSLRRGSQESDGAR
jgi:hypothetical protein